jgi:apolipoprotein N-acyltransferase
VPAPSAVAGDVSRAADKTDAASAPSRSPRLAPIGAAAAGGVLYFLGYLGYGVWPCMLVFLTPLWWALEGVRARRLSASLYVGLTFGLTGYVGGLLWLWKLVGPFLGGNRLLGVVLWLAYAAWFSFGFAVYAGLFRAVRRRGWSVAVAGVAPLVVVEWLQPQIFPLYAGAALVAAPAVWMQSADLGGPLLLSALVAGANVAVFESVVWWRGGRRRPLAVWMGTIAVALVVFAYGMERISAVESAVAAAPALRVGVVQANLSIDEKSTLSIVTHRRHLEQTRELLAAGDLDLVVWPETAYVRGIRGPLPVSGRPIVGELTVPLLFGANSVREENGRRFKTNSAFLVGADGYIREGYDKNLLIPLAEYMPFASIVPEITAWFPDVQEFAPVDDTPAIHLGPWRLATPICYEVIRPDFVRRMVARAEPQLLVTLANDGWFGDSQEPWIHLGLARLRAVEHRRFLVRATNTGISAIVDPAGRVVVRSGLLTRENLRGTVRPLEGGTVYGRCGDWVGWLCAAITAATLVIAAPRRCPEST